MKKIYRFLPIVSYPIIGIILALSTLVSLFLGPATIAKAAALPTYNYTKTIDTTNGYAQGGGIATDSAGNIYITGTFQGTVIFDGTGGSDSVTSSDYSTFITKHSNNGSYDWTKTFGVSGGSAYANVIATDASGNIYVTGYFTGTVTFDGPGGNDSVTSSNTSTFITKYSADGSYGWTKTFDTTNGDAGGYAITTDVSGNIFVTGNFYDTVIFDGPGGNDSVTSSNTSTFITKYNADGSYGWTKTFDTTNGSAFGYGIATDTAGDVYTTGEFNGAVVFDGPGGNDSQTALGSNESSYITKYSADGSYGWTKIFDSTSGNAYGYGVTVDSLGNIYETGNFTRTIIFDGVGGNDGQTSANHIEGDAYLTKYNSDGSYGWTKIFDVTAGWAAGVGVTTDSLNNVYMTGEFSGTVIFDGIGGSDSQTDTSGNGDAFLTQITSTGSYGWTKIFGTVHSGGVGDPAGTAVAVDTLGNAYITGIWFGTVTFDGAGGSDTITTGEDSVFLTSYDAFIPPVPVITATGNSGTTTTTAATSLKTPATGTALINANISLPILGMVATTAGIYVLSKLIKKSSN